MKQKQKNVGQELLSICHFKVSFKLYDPNCKPRSVGQFFRLNMTNSQIQLLNQKPGANTETNKDFRINGQIKQKKVFNKDYRNYQTDQLGINSHKLEKTNSYKE